MATTIKRGQTVKGKINLRSRPDQNSPSEFPYAIPVGALVELKFAGSPSVVLSTANVGEITIIDQTGSQISFNMPASKSALLTVEKNSAVDCVITDSSISPANVDIFEAIKVFNIEDPANA
jgi:predicted Fe-Mo cluster-binding NifX family protein